MLSQLIEALQILLKYGDPTYPTHCEHNVLYLCPGIRYEAIAQEDLIRLDKLGVHWDPGQKCFKSYRYGSA